MYSYLFTVAGPRTGEQFMLDEGKATRIGRGLECEVVLTDPLSSRVHAIVSCESGDWWCRDAGSRNGTYVSEQKIDEARVIDATRIRIGTTEFEFRQSVTLPTDPLPTATYTFGTEFDPGQMGEFEVDALRDPERIHDWLALHQVCVRTLRGGDIHAVIRYGMELLQARTQSSVTGFLWTTDEGQLKPEVILPEGKDVQLSSELTRIVVRDKRAIWTADSDDATGTSESMLSFKDHIAIPLIHEKTTLGAIHYYRKEVKFRQRDYDFGIPLANILTVALVRARREAVLENDQRRMADKAAVSDELIGQSKPMLDLKSKITRIARATGSVLVRGESGVGKELVARAVHRASVRGDRPMLSVNCAAIPRDLMESQLFGHKRGSFTGAEADHAGLFSQAHTGTLFLDEVGEMTLDGQAKLLRILEGHPFLPVGATKEVTVDVRVIAATNRDLRDFVREGKFREDLYYRLSVFELYIPPLRERGSDIELLVNHFLDHFKRQQGRPSLTLSPDAREKLLGYAWPGNVRQLRNVIDSAVVMSEGSIILPDDLGLRDAINADQLESLRIDFWERKLIVEALKRTEGNIPEAAKLLGVGRATIYRKIEEYGIDRK